MLVFHASFFLNLGHFFQFLQRRDNFLCYYCSPWNPEGQFDMKLWIFWLSCSKSSKNFLIFGLILIYFLILSCNNSLLFLLSFTWCINFRPAFNCCDSLSVVLICCWICVQSLPFSIRIVIFSVSFIHLS